MRVVWNDEKNAANRREHSINFEQAKALFDHGSDHFVIYDVEHSGAEAPQRPQGD